MTDRSEYEVAANTVWALIVRGVINVDRYNAHQLSIYVGLRHGDLEAAQELCEREGSDALKPREHAEPGTSAPRAHSNPHERRCVRCNEDLPVDQFDGRSRCCRICAEFRERDVYVQVRKGTAMKRVTDHYRATMTATPADDFIGDACIGCGHPLLVGDDVVVEGRVVHAKCEPV